MSRKGQEKTAPLGGGISKPFHGDAECRCQLDGRFYLNLPQVDVPGLVLGDCPAAGASHISEGLLRQPGGLAQSLELLALASRTSLIAGTYTHPSAWLWLTVLSTAFPCN